MKFDPFNKEERKATDDRLKRVEIMTDSLFKSLGDLNESLRNLNAKMDGTAWQGKLEAAPIADAIPEPVLMSAKKRDEVFEEKWAECRKECDSRFEMEMGVLKEIRSGIADTNSLMESIGKELIAQMVSMNATLGAILTKMGQQQPQTPQQVPWYVEDKTSDPMPKPTYKVTCDVPANAPTSSVQGDANPYIPEPTYNNDTANKEA